MKTGLSTCINLIKCRFLDTSLLHVLWFHDTTVVETGVATEDTYDKMRDLENSTRERVQGFIERAPKYDGNPGIMLG